MSGLFALPPGVDFAAEFVRGLHARLGDITPDRLARVRILCNTARAQRVIEDALADHAPRPGPLPRVELLSALGADPLSAPDIAPAIPPLRRHLRLTRLVEAYLAAARASGRAMAPLAAASDLAEALTLLLDQCDDEGIGLDALSRAVDPDALDSETAAHWHDSQTFLGIVARTWPTIRLEEEAGGLDPRARQGAVIDALIQTWKTRPPTDPIIAVATTGSVGSTARFLAALLRQPSGMVVLPGFDPDIDPTIWDAAGPDHPMGPMRRWMDALGMAPRHVSLWAETAPSARRELLHQALRPAPVTDHWHERTDALAALAPDATEGLTLIEADSPRAEADAIAIAMREAIETPGRTVTLMTPDAGVSRRVTASLRHFGITPDDSSGQPLALTPPGILLLLLLDIASGTADAVTLAALTQHPFAHGGLDRATALTLARRYERRVLRRRPPQAGLTELPPWPPEDAERGGRSAMPGAPSTSDPATAADTDTPPGTHEAEAWRAAINAAIAGLAEALANKAPLATLITAHRKAAEALSTGPGTAETGPSVWSGEDGAALDAFLARLIEASDAFGDAPVQTYPTLLRALLAGEQRRPRPREPHARVSIRGPREARVEAPDLVILAGLNDGTWPTMPDPGPWLSRQMTEAMGLPLPERAVGLAAHDFLQAACRPEVILSRSVKVDGTPTVASRWLTRLETLVTGVGAGAAWEGMRIRGQRLTSLARRHAAPAETMPRAPQPKPVARLPDTLSVTEIEAMCRDAYAVYARRILGLRPLDPLGRPADARERGTVIHAVFEAFHDRTAHWPGPEIARTILMEEADRVIAASVPWPDLRWTWRERIGRAATWFIRQEDARRATGAPCGIEQRGHMDLSIAGRTIRIRARADRIDRLEDGRAAVYDYKTGTPPTGTQIDTGFAHQLHLQAAILAQGGFETLPTMQAAHGAYLGITGSQEGGTETPRDGLSEQLGPYLENLTRFLAAYDAGAPWLAQYRRERVNDAGDYDHLSRRDEWAGGED